MPPDFLKNKRRKNTISLEKLIPKKTQTNFIVNNNINNNNNNNNNNSSNE